MSKNQILSINHRGRLTTTRNTIAGARSERTGSPPLKLSTVVAMLALGSDMMMGCWRKR
jgi:hypothetical protein